MILPDYNRLKELCEDALKASRAWSSTAGRLTSEVFNLTKERDELKAALSESITTNLNNVGVSSMEIAELRTRAETAEACCAEMRSALLEASQCRLFCAESMDIDDYALEAVNRAISTSCGKPILERVKRLEEALKGMVRIWESKGPGGVEREYHAAKQALETEAK